VDPGSYGVQSSGQMIALLTGITSLCTAIWDVVRPSVKTPKVDLLSSYAYLSRKPLRKEQMQAALADLVEKYDKRQSVDVDDW